jgi:hypothetical protein
VEPFGRRSLAVGFRDRKVTPLDASVTRVALAGEVEQVEGALVELDRRFELAGADRDVVDCPDRSSPRRLAA